MKSKPAVGLLTLLAVGLISWTLTSAIASAILGGREQFLDWRADNVALYYLIWLVEVIAIGLPVLWVVGRRMGDSAAQQDKLSAEARGVGRLAGAALRGDKKAVERLVKLLDDGSPAVKYQSARALAMLDDKAIDEEVFRKVRYWDGNLKLGLIDTLRRTMDARTVKILRMLGADRNPMVARKARTALGIVSSRSANIDDFVAKRRKQSQAKMKKTAAKKAKTERAGTATPPTAPETAPPTAPETAPPPAVPSSDEAQPADGAQSAAVTPAEVASTD